MPRNGKGSGGTRAGTPGQSYGNRTDLPGKVLAVTAPTGLGYGDRKALIDAQSAVPLGSAPAPAASAPAPQAGPPPPAPGSFGDFTRPTERPGEPLTAGNPMGPGAGREILPTPNPVEPDLVALAPWLPVLELRANAPDATVGMRNLVRRIRGAMPPDVRA